MSVDPVYKVARSGARVEEMRWRDRTVILSKGTAQVLEIDGNAGSLAGRTRTSHQIVISEPRRRRGPANSGPFSTTTGNLRNFVPGTQSIRIGLCVDQTGREPAKFAQFP